MLKKIAVITGASAGIGESTTRILAKNGYRVIATARREDRLKTLSEGLVESGLEASYIAGDIREENFIHKILNNGIEKWNRPADAFILCAGRGLPGTLLTSDPKGWQDLINTNYISVMHQLRSVGTHFAELAKNENCSTVRDILVIGSTVGRQVSAGNPVYGSTKFAVHSLVESLRGELCNLGIRVTLIEPGFVKSDFQESAGYDMKWFRSIENEIGPLLTPDDIAETIRFVIQQPPHVHLDDIRIRPTRQKV
ncbi:short-chain dehydrogenase [Leptospira perolatii]|uniref:Short-chain dehydrogenase n=1 Tax=Leptospira perolatii TaxID=2023191 RepID=A0A2M9ZJK3_9LEPT|nr:short-chain dehydrogenase [Leptospira perolatii]PJZ72212.1 short-chain dehydrogenase [Leptospira perolatii]